MSTKSNAWNCIDKGNGQKHQWEKNRKIFTRRYGSGLAWKKPVVQRFCTIRCQNKVWTVEEKYELVAKVFDTFIFHRIVLI